MALGHITQSEIGKIQRLLNTLIEGKKTRHRLGDREVEHYIDGMLEGIDRAAKELGVYCTCKHDEKDMPVRCYCASSYDKLWEKAFPIWKKRRRNR